MSKQPRHLTVTETADRLGCSRQNVLWLLEHKRLKGELVQWPIRCWLVSAASVKAYRRKNP